MDITPFWRPQKLSVGEAELIAALDRAHAVAALRDSPSTLALKVVADGSGRVENAIAAAICAIGGRHAPLPDIASFLAQSHDVLLAATQLRLARRETVPGWGNSFVKRGPDREWDDVAIRLREWPEIHAKLEAVTRELHAAKKMIWPNPGAYTAAVALAIGLPGQLAAYLFVRARLPVWFYLAHDAAG